RENAQPAGERRLCTRRDKSPGGVTMVSLPGFSLAAGHGRGRRALDHRKHGGWVAVAWLYLFVASAMEIAWSTAMKYSEGFTRFWPSVATIVLSLTSFVLL